MPIVDTMGSGWRPRDPTMTNEMICAKCGAYEPYAKWKTCTSGMKSYGKNKESAKADGPKWIGGHQMQPSGRRCPIPILSGPGQFKLNPIKRLIGYEIECSQHVDGNRINRLAEKYGAGMVHDGGDFEMNPPPMNGDKLVENLKYISDELRASGVKAGIRDGLHTHIDCRDLSYEEMRRVLVMYGKAESALYSIIDPRRFTNNSSRGGFSKPIGGPGLVSMFSDPTTAKSDIVSFVFGSNQNYRNCNMKDKTPLGGDRYLGLNLYSWFMRGTIEFRMHHGTTRWEKMLYWGMTLAGMVEAAITVSTAELNDWPTGLDALTKFAPTEECRMWIVKRWDYFASKRANKKQPILMVVQPVTDVPMSYDE